MKANFKRTLAIGCVILLFGSIAVSQDKAAPDPGLVGALTKQLGVNSQQATGGAGAIFSMVKSRLGTEEFSKIAQVVPGMGGFLNAAPKPTTGAGDITAAVSPMAGNSGAAAGMLSLNNSFKSLGMSPQMVTRFAPVIQQYLSTKGGSGVASIFSKAIGI